LAGFKRPANLKECDHYPTVRGLEIIWIAQILDCWRILFDTDDLNVYFEALDKNNQLPPLEFLIESASIIVQKYVSIGGYERVLSSRHQSELREKNLWVKLGSAWLSSYISNPPQEQMEHDIPLDSKDGEAFDGDRSLANSILFKMQFGSWLLLEYAIKDGDVGKVMQQLNEKDLTQEHNNGKLELMVDKSGGDFDSSYYRQIIAPNVTNFIQCGRIWETALELKHRSNSHSSPNACPELRALQAEFKSTELHFFRSGRTYPGHVAADLLTIGYNRLGTEGKLKTFLKKTTSRAKFITAIEKQKNKLQQTELEDINMHDDTLLPFFESSTPPPLLYEPTVSESDSESNDGENLHSDSNSSDTSIEEDHDCAITVEIEVIDASDGDNEEEVNSSDVPGSDDDIGCSSTDTEDSE
ncbi:hypothetical protein K435DRAFT_880874, partial [Dendrothele bispora CBS 962.96]